MVQLQQISALLDYLESHPEIAFGHFSRNKEGRSLANQRWMECAQILNSFGSGSSIKSPAEWRLFYNEYKSKLGKKIKLQNRESSDTSASGKKITLTPFQERLHDILRQDISEPLQENAEIQIISYKQEASEQPIGNESLCNQPPRDQPPSNQSLNEQPHNHQLPRRRRQRTAWRYPPPDRQHIALEAAQAKLERIETKNAEATLAHANATENMASAINRLAAATSESSNRLAETVEKIGAMISFFISSTPKKKRCKIVKVVQVVSSDSEYQ